jgi:hypothetical protein
MSQLVVRTLNASDEQQVRRQLELAGEGDILRVINADPVIFLASRGDLNDHPWGLWLSVGPDYPVQVAARDVKTLSHIITLKDVVLETFEHGSQSADVMSHLLSDAVVSLVNPVATLVNAVNRPAPPLPVTVWHVQGGQAISGGRVVDLVTT